MKKIIALIAVIILLIPIFSNTLVGVTFAGNGIEANFAQQGNHFQLPSTGSSSTITMLLLGVFIIIFGLVIIFINKKK
ncbi:MAG: hypothetical protein CSB16_00145 [Clostridiales bacterium]|nr:MAG: hypothetical protein CSB16_00145 [Clostridiales bacterium]